MIRRKPMVRKKPLGPGKVRLRARRSTPPATDAQIARWNRMREIGCVACLLNADAGKPTLRPYAPKLDIHHLTNGARRLGHDETICLCKFHHTGDWWPFDTAGYAEMEAIYGPAYHRAKRIFHYIYGSDAELLAGQNLLLQVRE